jgi:hypothetical protein
MKGEQGAHRQALVVQGLDQRHDAGGVGVERDADRDGDQHAERRCRYRLAGERVFGRSAVDEGAQADSDQQVGPDLAQDGADLLETEL